MQMIRGWLFTPFGALWYFCIGYALAALIWLYSTAAYPHDAVTGWTYPFNCCGTGDCGHALSANRNPDGSITVTTEHGTATFPATFKYERSPDGLIHACFTPDRISTDRKTLYCLYLSAGT